MELPQEFVAAMREQLGVDEYSIFENTLHLEPPVSVRLNPLKPSAFPDAEPVPWCPDGCYLPQRPSFTFDPLFHAGCYYVQEASSMYLSYVMRHVLHLSGDEYSVVLDLCAAPGGKSTLLLSELSDSTLVVCNEVIRQRAAILRENIIKWGAANTIVTNNQARDFQRLGTLFDFILCDAPCSGEGMFRKDPQSIHEWSPANVEKCQRRQRDILKDIWPCLRPGGILVYSTCTYNTLENEENVAWIADQLGAQLLDQKRFMPHKSRGEGLFMATLRKTSDDVLPVPRTPKTVRIPKTSAFPNWLTNKDSFAILQPLDVISAFPVRHLPLLELFKRHLKVLYHGIELAKQKGRDSIQPLHSLSMCNHLNIKAFRTIEVSREISLSYLHGDTLTLSPDVPRGYVLLTFQQYPIGFVNNIGTRANNLYPTEWRIKKQPIQ